MEIGHGKFQQISWDLQFPKRVGGAPAFSMQGPGSKMRKERQGSGGRVWPVWVAFRVPRCLGKLGRGRHLSYCVMHKAVSLQGDHPTISKLSHREFIHHLPPNISLLLPSSREEAVTSRTAAHQPETFLSPNTFEAPARQRTPPETHRQRPKPQTNQTKKPTTWRPTSPTT